MSAALKKTDGGGPILIRSKDLNHAARFIPDGASGSRNRVQTKSPGLLNRPMHKSPRDQLVDSDGPSFQSPVEKIPKSVSFVSPKSRDYVYYSRAGSDSDPQVPLEVPVKARPKPNVLGLANRGQSYSKATSDSSTDGLLDQVTTKQAEGGGTSSRSPSFSKRLEENANLVQRLEALSERFPRSDPVLVYQRKRLKKNNDKAAITSSTIEQESVSDLDQIRQKNAKVIAVDAKERLGKEIEAMRKGKMPQRDFKRDMELLKMGKFFGACTEDNQITIQNLIEKTATGIILSEAEAEMESMQRIEALTFDSEDLELDDMEEEEEGLETTGEEGGTEEEREATRKAIRKGKAVAKRV